MKFLIAIGLVLGFAYEFGMTWYATRPLQVRDRPHFGLDVIILYGLIGAFWGGLLAAVMGTVYRRLELVASAEAIVYKQSQKHYE